MTIPHKLASLVALVFCLSPQLSTFGDDSKKQSADNIKHHKAKEQTIPGHGMGKGEYPYNKEGFYQVDWVSIQAKSPVRSSVTVRHPIDKSSKEHSYFVIQQYEAKHNKTQVAKTEPKKPETKPQVTQKPEDFTPAMVFNPYEKQAPQRPATYDIPRARVISDQRAIAEGFIGPYDKMKAPQQSYQVATNQMAIPAPASMPRTVPVPGRPTTVAVHNPKSTASMFPSSHQVDIGDTLYNISRRYNVSIEAIKKANNLTSDLIRVGQSLRLALAQHTLGVPRG